MADVTVTDQGDLLLFRLNSGAAYEWIEESVDSPPFAWRGPDEIIVENGYAEGLMSRIEAAGFSVEIA